MESNRALDLSRPFLPEGLSGDAGADDGVLDEDDRRRLNQIRASSYLHVFDVLEACVSDAARAHAMHDIDARDALAPLLRLDTFDHGELFHRFERTFAGAFPVTPRLLSRPADLDAILREAVPLSLLVLALHLKLVTQQHYLACVRGNGTGLEPSFVGVLKEHWCLECGREAKSAAPALQQAIADSLPGRVPAALRDYKRIVFVVDDVLRRQSELDVATLEEARGARLGATKRAHVLAAQVSAHRKTFIDLGIVNAGFVYALRGLGPAAPSMLAKMVSRHAIR